MSITIDGASQAVDLSAITQNAKNSIPGGASEIFTISSLAKSWNISPRTIQKTIKAMSQSGIEVGMQNSPHEPIILTQSDASKIDQWRSEHPPGRPKTVDA